MTTKKPLTLIELMVAISLVLLATSTMGWKMYGMIAKKRFSSSVERFRSRLLQ
jgi:type II secretory pathway pseudopilin PulG